MIEASRIYSWAMKRLALDRDPGFNVGDARTALADTLLLLDMQTPHTLVTQTVKTVAGQSDYALPEHIGIIESIAWPSTWTDGEVAAVTLQQLQTIRENIAAGIQDTSSSHPVFYALSRVAGGTTTFSLESAASVAGDETITVRYYRIAYDEYNQESGGTNASQSGEIDAPPSLELALKAGTAWNLAEIYAIDKAAFYKARFDELVRVWRSRMLLPDDRPQQIDILPH